MKTPRGSVPNGRRRGNESSRPALLASCPTAFTLIELLVVIATMAVLAAMLLPALAGTQSQSKVTACTARFRQWAVSHNLYANDHRGWLPSLVPQGGGALAWDVGLNLCNTLYPYGMDVPVWFCPMRPNQWDAANAWGQANLRHPIQNGNDLTEYFSRTFPQELVLNDNYWVPRPNSASLNAPLFPIDYSAKNPVFLPSWLKQGMPTSLFYGWPQRLHDIAASQVPFVSDSAGSGYGGGLISTNVSANVGDMSPNTAHFVNGALTGVNLAFADGHVASHTPSQMRAVYYNGASYWFY
jgi:prepilin-type processing-associated H-X9-DG protein